MSRIIVSFDVMSDGAIFMRENSKAVEVREVTIGKNSGTDAPVIRVVSCKKAMDESGELAKFGISKEELAITTTVIYPKILDQNMSGSVTIAEVTAPSVSIDQTAADNMTASDTEAAVEAPKEAMTDEQINNVAELPGNAGVIETAKA